MGFADRYDNCFSSLRCHKCPMRSLNCTGFRTMPSKVRQFAKTIVRATGFELRRTKELSTHAPGIRHAEVFPGATYSPWLADEEFKYVHALIRSNTLVDTYRCYATLAADR